MPFDSFLFNFFHGLAGRAKLLDWLGIIFAHYIPYVLAIYFLIFLWRVGRTAYGRFYYFLFSAIVLIFTRGLITEALRFFIQHPRPFAALGFTPLIDPPASMSFPSGHAVVFFAMAAIILWISIKRRPGGWFYSGEDSDLFKEEKRHGVRTAIWFFIGAFFVGTARIFVGVHWPLDIVAGALTGLLGVIVVSSFLSLSR